MTAARWIKSTLVVYGAVFAALFAVELLFRQPLRGALEFAGAGALMPATIFILTADRRMRCEAPGGDAAPGDPARS